MQSLYMTCLNGMQMGYIAYLNVLVNLGIYLDLFYQGYAQFIYRIRAKSSMFSMLEGCGKYVGRIFGFVIFF